jgi:hypothetical protein
VHNAVTGADGACAVLGQPTAAPTRGRFMVDEFEFFLEKTWSDGLPVANHVKIPFTELGR